MEIKVQKFSQEQLKKMGVFERPNHLALGILKKLSKSIIILNEN